MLGSGDVCPAGVQRLKAFHCISYFSNCCWEVGTRPIVEKQHLHVMFTVAMSQLQAEVLGHTKRRRDDGTGRRDSNNIFRSKWTIADDDGTVWAVVDDGQSCCLRLGARGVVCIDDVKS